jgi:hypothetical protein
MKAVTGYCRHTIQAQYMKLQNPLESKIFWKVMYE